MSELLQEYLEALRVIGRAPAAAKSGRARADEAAARAQQAADEALRTVVTERQQLERRVREVGGWLAETLARHGVDAAGPRTAVPVPAPRTIRDALDAIDQVERQVRADLAELASARNAAPAPPGRWRRYAPWVGAILAVIVTIILVHVLA